jgi:monoterpene epsilon-lactone hydrolase
MQSSPITAGMPSWLAFHPITPADQQAMSAMRAIVEPNKGKLQGIEARGPFDAIMEQVSAPNDIDYEADNVGGVAGWWCRPEPAQPGRAILHLHGGWFNWGSARSYRHLAGHLASTTGVPVFLPEYRLAPEHPFPAAIEDLKATFAGLRERGFTKIAVTGDSAGGNLAIGLLVHVASASTAAREPLAGGVALSPVTDLTLSGSSWWGRASSDPYFTKTQVRTLVESYLAGHDPTDPLASPLQADLKGLAPLCVHVGNDEVLLDDSVRLVERVVSSGVDARLDVWEGMVHGFLGGMGHLDASTEALQLVGKFLVEVLA